MMKDVPNLTFILLGWIREFIDVDGIKNKVLKFITSVIAFPVCIFFLMFGLCIEEPIKHVFVIVTMKNSPKEVWTHYKKCWSALFGGI